MARASWLVQQQSSAIATHEIRVKIFFHPPISDHSMQTEKRGQAFFRAGHVLFCRRCKLEKVDARDIYEDERESWASHAYWLGTLVNFAPFHYSALKKKEEKTSHYDIFMLIHAVIATLPFGFSSRANAIGICVYKLSRALFLLYYARAHTQLFLLSLLVACIFFIR